MPHLASLVFPGFTNNECFDLATSEANDNRLSFAIELRRAFLKQGIELNTPDLNDPSEVGLELHIDVQRQCSNAPRYLLMLETPMIHPDNRFADRREYSLIFTWNDSLVGRDNFVKTNFSIVCSPFLPDGLRSRHNLCCMIASNKSSRLIDRRELYSERVKVIRWFESNSPNDFALYGRGWQTRPRKAGTTGRAVHLIMKNMPCLNRHHLRTYKGRVGSKASVLKRTRFSFCFENAQGFPGYITEKIFDSFNSGCVPIYWGASNIDSYIPRSCFIDYRQFMNVGLVYDFIRNIGERQYREYQENIYNFIRSDRFRPFASDTFGSKIVKSVCADLTLHFD